MPFGGMINFIFAYYLQILYDKIYQNLITGIYYFICI